MTLSPEKRPIIGWREWIEFPHSQLNRIKVKVDTGARSSALHAFNLHFFKRSGEPHVEFDVHPKQRQNTPTIRLRAPVIEYREITSSSGHRERRPVIPMTIQLFDQIWTIEVTLTNRDLMGFRMLLGREAIKGRFLVDANRSYYGGKPKVKKRSP